MFRNVLEYLENDVLNFKDKIAVIDETKKYTYGEFSNLSRKIGSFLATKTNMRMPVAVLMEKSADTLCAFMGIVYAGCFYVQLNPEFPASRHEQILSVLNAKLIITDEAHKEAAVNLIGEENTLLISDLMNEAEDSSVLAKIRNRAIDTDPLYANFTSGSTGVPKGVVVGHRSVLDFIDLFAPMFSIESNDIIGNQAPFDFDVSVKDIYSALKVGATLVIVPKHLFSSPGPLIDFICDQKITTMVWAVSALCLITTCHGLDYRTPTSVKRVLFSGEVMPLKHLNAWMTALPEAEFVNLYGPTEITCNCTYHRIDRNRDYSAGIPIGQAFPNEHVFLLDENNNEVTEEGKTGEICVRGSALALGYFRSPEQTEKAFPNNPLNSCYPERIYRTGDLGQYIDEENLIFCGRKDFQIKYMGHRIEIEEIERAISGVSGVERCCVIFDEAKSKLYGFYVGDIVKRELHSVLAKDLPIYMIPGSLRKIESFPLTKNGKIDRKELLKGKA